MFSRKKVQGLERNFRKNTVSLPGGMIAPFLQVNYIAVSFLKFPI